MAELTQKERLQPSLLDRLTDDEPDKLSEAREQRVLSLSKLRVCVLRDLAWLLNTSKLEAVQNFEGSPLAAHSVVNYGIPDLAGMTLSSANVVDIEQQVKQAIWDFEPRILRDSVRVKVSVSEQQMNHNAMSFDIEGDLWAQPLPLHLYLRTELDLETGNMEITDKGS
ncbi:MAG: type VI secretion system baseplate subunit TssE [Methylococcaceae bacterium]|nr:type VI secretion system baseplate subunit TssE [Methylococcaceae bacterium]